MYLVSCPAQSTLDPEDLLGDLAEVIEMKLMGAQTIGDQSWDDYANDLLHRYHRSKFGKSFDSRPLWRSLYEAYCRLDKSYSPNVVFMQIIKALRVRLSTDFPVEEISRNVLMDYLDKEMEKAMSFE